MDILTKQTGVFKFLLKNMEEVTYTDYRDIPEDLSEFATVIKFLPDIPPPPHTARDHSILYTWQERFKTIVETIRNV